MKSARYPSLVTKTGSKAWYFRKYSSDKAAEFCASTGLEATEKNAAAAYKAGLDKFNEWLGLHGAKTSTVREIGSVLEAEKLASKAYRTHRVFAGQLKNHINPYFGHMRPEQVANAWERFAIDKRKAQPGFQLFNSRKAMREILRRAHQHGMIRTVPSLKISDRQADPPKYIDRATFARIETELTGNMRLLVQFMHHQGARPSEVLQYRWEDVNLKAGTLYIRAETTKTRRARTIPLAPAIHELLSAMEPASPWLFPSHIMEGEPVREYAKVWGRAMDELKLDFTIYNLRDSFITDRLREGISAVFIGKYTDTSAAMIERRYAVATEDVMRLVAGYGRKKSGKGVRK